jgi:signal transduction histidine kinase
VSAALAAGGWMAALVVLGIMRRRLELVARAEHELRGPVTVIGLAAERLGAGESAGLDVELHRMRMALADLTAARRGRRAGPRPAQLRLEHAARGAVEGWRDALGDRGRRATVDWQAGPTPIRADPGRLAQALGNLVANAAEHGRGPVELRGRRTSGGVRVEVRNRTKGRRGLEIAKAAARDNGGELRFEADGEDAVAALDRPVPDDPELPQPPAA